MTENKNDLHRDEDSLSKVLRETHARNLEAYRSILLEQGGSSSGTKHPFWDIIVVTAGDVQQRVVYQRRIDEKLAQGRIPAHAKYHVIDDPPKSKIGSGGSTCLVMKIIQDHYSQEFLSSARVLLVHAGGYSTRLPHVSARGKVFTTLPQADLPDGIQVLELKLVLYLNLLKDMPPGVFLTSADGIELFSSKSSFPSDPKPLTITAFAHPSSTLIGSTHGVYILQDPQGRVERDRKLEAQDQSALLIKCQQFLHKPSEDVMRSTPNVIHSNGSKDITEVVYTDSCYYFDPKTAMVMAQTYEKLHMECDLEAWADILSFLDTVPPTSSAHSDLYIPSENPHLQARQIVKRALQQAGVALDVMVLNASKFYHLGTMQEFLAGATTDKEFMSELHIRNDVSGIAWVNDLDRKSTKVQGCIHPPAYIENSTISPTASILANSIIVDSDLPSEAIMPMNTCMFTLQLQEHEFVTFTFSLKDEMKKAIRPAREVGSQAVVEELKIFEHVPVKVMLPLDAQPQEAEEGLSLWTASVFEVAKTKTDSVRLALNRLHRIQSYLEQGRVETSNNDAIRGDYSSSEGILGWTSLRVAARRAREY